MHPSPESFLPSSLIEQPRSSHPSIHVRRPEVFQTRTRRQNSRIFATAAVLMCLSAVLAVLVGCYSFFGKVVRPASLWRRLAGVDGQGDGDQMQSEIISLCSEDQQSVDVSEDKELLQEKNHDSAAGVESFVDLERKPQSEKASASSLALAQPSEVFAAESQWQRSTAGHRAYLRMHMAWLQKIPRSTSASVFSGSLESAPLIGLSDPYTSTAESQSSLNWRSRMPTDGRSHLVATGLHDEQLVPSDQQLAPSDQQLVPSDQREGFTSGQRNNQGDGASRLQKRQERLEEAGAASLSLAYASQGSRKKVATESHLQQTTTAPGVYHGLQLVSAENFPVSSSTAVFSGDPGMAPLMGFSDPNTSTETSSSGVPIPLRTSSIPHSAGTPNASSPSSLQLHGSLWRPWMGSTSGELQQEMSSEAGSVLQEEQPGPSGVSTGLTREHRNSHGEGAPTPVKPQARFEETDRASSSTDASQRHTDMLATAFQPQHSIAGQVVYPGSRTQWLQPLLGHASSSVLWGGLETAPLPGSSDAYMTASRLPILLQSAFVPHSSGMSTASSSSSFHILDDYRRPWVVLTSGGRQHAFSHQLFTDLQEARPGPSGLSAGRKHGHQGGQGEGAQTHSRRKTGKYRSAAAKLYRESKVLHGAEKAAAAHFSSPPTPHGSLSHIELSGWPSTSTSECGTRASLHVPKLALPRRKSRKRKERRRLVGVGFACKIEDYRLPGPAPPDPHHENAFYSLPVFERGTMKKKFNHETLFDGKGPRKFPKAISRLRSLLAARTLSVKDASDVIEKAEQVARYMLNRHQSYFEGRRPSKVVRTLGRRFLCIEALFTAIQVVGEPMQAQHWWIRFLTLVPTHYNPEYTRHLEATPHHVSLAVKLSQALEMLKSGRRPDADTIVALKEALLSEEDSPKT